MTPSERRSSLRRILVFTGAGALAGYLLLHPLAMVIDHLASPHASAGHARGSHPSLAQHLAKVFSLSHAAMAAYWVVVCASVGAAIALGRERLRARSERIRMLEELLPICANCKLIREDDKWVPVERYISARTGAEFTHSLCPRCVKELYPNLSHGPTER